MSPEWMHSTGSVPDSDFFRRSVARQPGRLVRGRPRDRAAPHPRDSNMRHVAAT